MYYGAAWYPEHWPAARWDEDIRLMRAAGMNVCRIAEFAWSTMEPTEGYYTFDWLESAVDKLHSNGIAVVLGTPTAAPPAWLTHHHPDTIATEPDGRLAQHGNRCHYNPGSVTYQKYARRIVEQMVKRFGHDPRVIGWQIDNEYNRVDYSEDTGRRFQAYLKERFGSLDALNSHWSTAYWSQSYSDWREIPIPIGPHNPGLMLAFRHFVTRVWADFQRVQIDAIRTGALPSHWITHNFMGWFDGFDHYVVSKDLDLVSWDWYVGSGHHDYLSTGVVHDLTRGLKRQNFWLMETQPGCVNWSQNNNMLNKGEARCMAWHAVAHGADALLYWQWRSAYGGQEQLHGSLIGADGAPRPFYSEAALIGSDIAALNSSVDLSKSSPVNDVAILHSYDSRWSINAQRHNKSFDPVSVLNQYARPFAVRNIGVDVVSSEAALETYKLVIAPAIAVLTVAAEAEMAAFVERGGTLVLGVRTGQKDDFNALLPALQPGRPLLRKLAGVEVAEYYALDDPAPVSLNLEGTTSKGESKIWAELLRPLGDVTKVVATYGEFNGWLDGGAAITVGPTNANGGKVIVVGALLDDEAQGELTDWLANIASIEPAWPDRIDGVEFSRRRFEDSAEELLFIINHNRTAQDVTTVGNLDPATVNILTQQAVQGTLHLQAYDVAVLNINVSV